MFSNYNGIDRELLANVNTKLDTPETYSRDVVSREVSGQGMTIEDLDRANDVQRAEDLENHKAKQEEWELREDLSSEDGQTIASPPSVSKGLKKEYILIGLGVLILVAGSIFYFKKNKQ